MPSSSPFSDDPAVSYSFGLPTCIPLTDAEFSAVTASFTLGGLIGSLWGNSLGDQRGRKGAIKVDAMVMGAGAALMTVASNMGMLLVGR